MITIQEMNGHAKKVGLVYEMMLTPLSKEIGIPQTALSILLFLANNPDYATARDVCEMRGLKRAIVSTHVERMVSEGLLERRGYPGDRRKELLIPTEKALPIIETGREAQRRFAGAILEGLSENELAVMERCFRLMNGNIDRIIKSCGVLQGENEK
ncbi:MAG: winged helix-turn-helix transcriptional regulator [Ruminococcaceae bacterium]|nr:winged helix-turn-helix transcriptional regulator [Oscillospiraceae bacterium]MBO5041224.1 winged helix-turn-helix transcriptional regulator [Clostridia bacterium]